MEKLLSRRYQNNGKSNIKLNATQIKQRNIVNQLVDNGEYLFEDIPCIICGNTDFNKLSEKDRYGLYHPVVICTKCGLIQNSPRMTQQSYNHFYNNNHRRLYVGTENITKEYLQQRYTAGEKTAEYLNQYLNIQNSKILEVGCGSGAILKYLHDQGAIVKGIDLSKEYLEFGRKEYKIDLENTDFLKLPEKIKYDVIIYSDVLEHILNISDHLAKVKSLLSENGVLYIRVPGVKMTHKSYKYDFLNSLQNAHVYYFTLDSLKNLMHKNGFDLINGNENVQSIWKPATKTAKNKIQSDLKSSLDYLQNLEKKYIKT